jgi:hypothetical protein
LEHVRHAQAFHEQGDRRGEEVAGEVDVHHLDAPDLPPRRRQHGRRGDPGERPVGRT